MRKPFSNISPLLLQQRAQGISKLTLKLKLSLMATAQARQWLRQANGSGKAHRSRQLGPRLFVSQPPEATQMDCSRQTYPTKPNGLALEHSSTQKSLCVCPHKHALANRARLCIFAKQLHYGSAFRPRLLLITQRAEARRPLLCKW